MRFTANEIAHNTATIKNYLRKVHYARVDSNPRAAETAIASIANLERAWRHDDPTSAPNTAAILAPVPRAITVGSYGTAKRLIDQALASL